jgi:nucleoside-diphosphate-sugar epimerase
MTEKRILITGTDGFIGSHLKEHFLNEGYKVYGTTYFRDPEDEREVRMDFSKDEEFDKLWTNITFPTVIHTVGVVDTEGSIPDEIFEAVQTGGTKRITEYAKKQGCEHFIFTSSIAAYGKGSMREGITEENTERKLKKNLTPYGRTKVKAEMIIEESGLNYTNLRLSIVQGKKDTFITQSIVPMLEDQKPFTCGKEDKKVSLMYIKNFGPMISRILKKGPFNENLNCISHNVGWNELVTEYAKNLNVDYNPKRKNFMWIYLTRNRRRPGDKLVAAFSYMGSEMTGEALYKKLEGWTPPYSWKEGIKEAVDKYLKTKK